MSRVAAILTHEKNFNDACKKMFASADVVAAKVDAIHADEGLTPEQKKVNERQVRDDAKQTWSDLVAQANHSYECATDLIRKSRLDVKPRDDARARVTKLLGSGLAPGQILERAEQQGDEETLIALRWELHYWTPTNGKFTDADQTILACDRVLSKIAVGKDERDRSSASVKLADAKAGLETIRRYALKGADGIAKGEPRIAAAYAMAGTPDVGSSDGDA